MTGLYVHIPFCTRKCGYCDFYSLPGQNELIGEYIRAVRQEAGRYQRLECDTLYIGGGTPSLLSAEDLASLLSGLYQTCNLGRLTEATIEINPDSASFDFLSTARPQGVKRVSIGVQSLNDKELQAAGRIHNARQAISAIMETRNTGFTAISADLIIGLPWQDRQSLQYSLEYLTGMGLEHISVYCLSIEPDTPFARNRPAGLPSENTQADLYEQCADFLEHHGYSHYEIANFARPGYECRHNLNYWRGGEYAGLGPSAASHLENKRYKNKPALDAYIANPTGQITEEETLAPAAKAAEEAMLRLRLLKEGLDMTEMIKRFGEENTAGLARRLADLSRTGLLKRHGSRYRLPPERTLTSNPILARVLGN